MHIQCKRGVAVGYWCRAMKSRHQCWCLAGLQWSFRAKTVGILLALCAQINVFSAPYTLPVFPILKHTCEPRLTYLYHVASMVMPWLLPQLKMRVHTIILQQEAAVEAN